MSRNFRLGIFIVSGLAILSAGVFLIGSRRFLFSSTYQIETTFKNVSGLNEGAEVRVGGIQKGTVQKIRLPAQPVSDMTVEMALDSSTRKVVRQDSIASIQTEGLLGSKYIEISFGSESAPQVSNGSHISSVPPLEMADLLKKTNEVLDTTKETMVNVKQSSDHFAEISAKINDGKGTVGALVNDRKFYDNLQEATNQAKVSASAFAENMEALKTNFFLRGFFNRRGYQDSTKLAENEIAELPQGQVLKTFRLDHTKLFNGPETAKLKNEKMLNEVGKYLEQNPFGAAVVVVSGPATGDATEIHELTQARGMIVRDYLVEHFKMDDTRLKKMSLGKIKPNADDSALVQVILYQPGTRLPPEKSARR
jgi:phospholipid/cholesterol/gamma-HCH transport system substrate-binding protein